MTKVIANLSTNNYVLADLQYEWQVYLLNTIAKKQFPHLKRCRKLFLNFQLFFKYFVTFIKIWIP